MANHITVLRKKAGYKYAYQLAEKLEVSTRMMHAIENNERNPSIKLAAKMASLLNCNLDDIFMPYLPTISVVR